MNLFIVGIVSDVATRPVCFQRFNEIFHYIFFILFIFNIVSAAKGVTGKQTTLHVSVALSIRLQVIFYEIGLQFNNSTSIDKLYALEIEGNFMEY